MQGPLFFHGNHNLADIYVFQILISRLNFKKPNKKETAFTCFSVVLRLFSMF